MNVFKSKSLRQLIANFRNEYISNGIDEVALADNPIDQFEIWLHEAIKNKLPEPNLMHLSTATCEGKPSGRIMLLKGFDNSGFVFFSNYESRKGNELTRNPYAAITFLWLALVRQVRIEGKVSMISAAESDVYFQSRPRTSQISAWISEQSKVLCNRAEFENRFRQADKLFNGKPVDRPPHWGGYCLKPSRVEFWQGRAGRMHDRIAYIPNADGGWEMQRLFP